MRTQSPVVNQTKFDDTEFKKSSYSQPGATITCVAVAKRPNVVAVRHTRDPRKTTLEYTIPEWKAFIAGVKKGEFDV